MAEGRKATKGAKRDEAPDGIRDRIVGWGRTATKKLIANPKNWRTHGKEQETALGDLMEQVGWIQSVIVNKRTGMLVDGHLRVRLAQKHGVANVPVIYVDLSPKEEALVLAAMDPIAGLAGVDQKKLAEVLRGVEDPKGAGLATLIADLSKKIGEGGDVIEDAPEVPFTEELLEEHNYVVLYFDNTVDWLHLLSLYPLREVKSKRSKGRFQQIGVGRVVRGIEFLRKVTGESVADEIERESRREKVRRREVKA